MNKTTPDPLRQNTPEDFLRLVRHRRSVRTFDGRALSPEDAQRILAYAETVKNPYGLSIRWQMLDAKTARLSSPVIVGEATYLTGTMDRVPGAEEAFGFSFERILLFADSLGIGSTWIAGTMDRAAFERAAGKRPGEVMPCVSPLGYPASAMSFREKMMRKGVKADSRLDFETLFFSRSFDAPLARKNAGRLEPLLEAVRLAPSAVNKQPWRLLVNDRGVYFYEKKNRGFAGADGWDLQKIDLGIAMCHFSLGLEACGFSASFSREDPGLPAPAELSFSAGYLWESGKPEEASR
ncbi:MAG: nitroreductase [Clostridia bacterium]|nr:nitroreductase [Clostridia bacterium]